MRRLDLPQELVVCRALRGPDGNLLLLLRLLTHPGKRRIHLSLRGNTCTPQPHASRHNNPEYTDPRHYHLVIHTRIIRPRQSTRLSHGLLITVSGRQTAQARTPLTSSARARSVLTARSHPPPPPSAPDGRLMPAQIMIIYNTRSQKATQQTCLPDSPPRDKGPACA